MYGDEELFGDLRSSDPNHTVESPFYCAGILHAMLGQKMGNLTYYYPAGEQMLTFEKFRVDRSSLTNELSDLKNQAKGEKTPSKLRETIQKFETAPGFQFRFEGANNVAWANTQLYYLAITAKNSEYLEHHSKERNALAEKKLPKTSLAHDSAIRDIAAGRTTELYAGTVEASLIHGPGLGLDADPIDRVREDVSRAGKKIANWVSGYKRQKVKVDVIAYLRDGVPILLLNAAATPEVP